MELALRHQKNIDQTIAGAYLHGNVADWFNEISFWAIKVDGLKGYLVPQSIAHNNCVGIFIVFENEIPKRGLVRNPYRMVSEGFFIPSDAKLFPNIDADEIQKIKLWEIQFFHPHVGLVGFETKDVQDLSDLIALPILENRDWRTVWPNVTSQPQIRTISLTQDGDLDALENLKILIDNKPLSDIPELEEPAKGKFSELKKLLRPLVNMGIWLMLILGFMVRFILKAFSFLLPKTISEINNMQKPSWLHRLDSWINKQMDFLEKQRDTELNRLVKMFDKDKDLALQYAIPLNSPYLDRGIAKPSGRLTRRSLNFNFNRFGSGVAADVWDIGNYRWVLQERYEKVASESISNGDYKRAAYVYAHLLGDFFRAANTLRDGKHYREAAAIFKDHLKNERLAAECLEQAGLLNEAIVLYIKMEHYETVGNLYLQLGQEESAAKYFEEVIKKYLAARDYLKASNIIIEKFGDLERAQAVVLEGWHHNNKREQCLSKYFEIVVKRGFTLTTAVSEFHQSHVTRTKRTSFLYVLADLFASSNDTVFKDEALSICYQVVHQQATIGDFNALKILGLFIPEDRLIDQDLHRYAIRHQQVRHQSAEHFIQLDNTIEWKYFCNFNTQLFGIGLKVNEIRLLRMNWDEDLEYSFLTLLDQEAIPVLISDPGLSDDMLLVSPKIANRNEFFDVSSSFLRSATLRQINWVTPDTIGLALDPRGNLTILEVQGEDIMQHTHDINGKRLETCICTLDAYNAKASEMSLQFSKSYWRKEHLYFITQKSLVRTDKIGVMDVLPFEGLVLDFSISVVHAAIKIAVLTSDGCVLVRPSPNEMKIDISMFGDELSADKIQLLPNNSVVLATNQKAQVYDLGNHKATLLFEVNTDHDILQIISVPKRNHFALITADHQISTYMIPIET